MHICRKGDVCDVPHARTVILYLSISESVVISTSQVDVPVRFRFVYFYFYFFIFKLILDTKRLDKDHSPS